MTASVVLIGLDSSDIGRIDQLVEAGRMPNLARLRRSGQHGRLRARLHHFEAMAWPRWTEGRDLSKHYFTKIWRPDSMTFELVREDWEPRPPFWAHLARAGAKIGVMDVPHASVQPHGAASYVKGWQTEIGTRASAPERLWSEISRRFGRPRMLPEPYGMRSAAYYSKLHAQLLAATEQAGAIGAWLLGRESWDVFVIVFGTTHRAGHYLWDRSQVDPGWSSAALRAPSDGALDDVYAAADAALGRILDAAPGARCLAFTPKGMESNTGWVYHFEQVMAALEAGTDGAKSNLTPLGRLRQSLPRRPLIAATNLLPEHLRSRLMRLLTSRLRDWSKTRYLALPGEPEGFIRINLAGRESLGKVLPGADREALVTRLRDELMTLRDLETDLPVVDQVTRVDDLVSEDAPERYWLPDLVISWTNEFSAQASCGVRFHGRGEVRWPRGVAHISGRSGTHNGIGWYAAAGPGIRPGVAREVPDPIDIAPTVCRWLGVRPADHFDGTPIESLLADDRPPARQMASAGERSV